MEVSSGSDEMYIIEKSKKLRSTDPCSAKSWIITAKTLFPNNFNVQVSFRAVCLYLNLNAHNAQKH